MLKRLVPLKNLQENITISWEVKQCRINNLDLKPLKIIFSYVNVIELVIITRVCTKWKRVIEKSPDILLSMNLAVIPQKINSLNFIKVLTKAQMLKNLVLSENMAITDTLSFLMMVPKSLESLTISNINIEFATVLGNIMLPNVTTLDLSNKVNRKKNLNSNEIKAISNAFPKLQNLILNAVPIDDEGLQLFFSRIENLEYLSLLRCENLTNIIFVYLAKYCNKLKHLSFGGSPTNYNGHFTFEGIEVLCQINSDLETIRIEYCSRIGEQCVELLFKRFGESLKEFHLVRNCFEKCSKITDKLINKMEYVPNLEKLSFVYIRSFREKFHIYLSSHLHKLKVLNIRECPMQEDFSVLWEGCPLLEEVDMSGDSWVKCETVLGLSKHKNLKIFRLGHLEHAEGQCDKGLGEFPPKGMFLESIFKSKDAFPNLRTLYLEQICGLTYWLDIRIKKLRPELEIKYTLYDKTLNFSQMMQT